MMRPSAAALALCCLAAPALAQEKKEAPPAAADAGAGPDMSKMGPWSRKPTNEARTKKEVAAFFEEEDALMKKRDFDGMLARMDFPVFMLTDDSKGVPMAKQYSREDYVKEMKGFWDSMPKDMKVTHRPTVTVLSDSLVTVTDDFRMQMGGKNLSGRNQAFLVKRDGKWMWKQMAEAGWGDASQADTGGSAK
jgi:hypothetical protein